VAFEKYKQLADLTGNSTAQSMVGFMYATGIGGAVERDQSKVGPLRNLGVWRGAYRVVGLTLSYLCSTQRRDSIGDDRCIPTPYRNRHPPSMRRGRFLLQTGRRQSHTVLALRPTWGPCIDQA